MPQEAHLRRRLQEPRGGLASAFAQRRLTKRSRELRKAEVGLRRILFSRKLVLTGYEGPLFYLSSLILLAVGHGGPFEGLSLL